MTGRRRPFAAVTYKYNDPTLKELVPRMDQVRTGSALFRRLLAPRPSRLARPCAYPQVITASATVVALAYAGVAMAVCSFVSMLVVLIVAHFRNGELHGCWDFCEMLVSRHAFRSEDSWLG